MLATLSDHQRWLTCKACDLCKTRTNVCLVRGTLPCDILFIGEAPGESEDIIGEPFIGPAGKLLDEIIRTAHQSCFPECDFESYNDTPYPRYAITNVIACLPVKVETDGDTIVGRGFREPTKQEAKACEPRLREIISIAHPKVTVTLGLIAQRYLPKDLGIPNTHMIHPAAILRSERSGLEKKRCVLTLAGVFRRLYDPQ